MPFHTGIDPNRAIAQHHGRRRQQRQEIASLHAGYIVQSQRRPTQKHRRQDQRCAADDQEQRPDLGQERKGLTIVVLFHAGNEEAQTKGQVKVGRHIQLKPTQAGAHQRIQIPFSLLHKSGKKQDHRLKRILKHPAHGIARLVCPCDEVLPTGYAGNFQHMNELKCQ